MSAINPTHYQGKMQWIDAIRDALTEEEFRGFCKGTALQYIRREAEKGGDEDIQKAIWYLERLVE